eukprot:gene13168-15176_t
MSDSESILLDADRNTSRSNVTKTETSPEGINTLCGSVGGDLDRLPGLVSTTAVLQPYKVGTEAIFSTGSSNTPCPALEKAALAGTSGTTETPKQQQQAPSHNDTFNGSKKLPPKMSLFLLLLLALCTLIPLTAADTVTFSATGATQTFTVPTGVTLITFDLRGARGGFVGTNNAGSGARVVTDITVVPGEVLNINVGAAGLCLTTAQGMVFGGGGPSAIADAAGSYGGTGGGATDVRRGGTGVGNRIAVAGGGGGIYNCGGTNIAGGNGGQVGLMGNKCFGSTTVTAGTGGTQSAGGTGGYYTSVCLSPVPAGAGTQTSGGAATSCKGDGGGGGGGGYWGGGGGANGGSGGGGSSYSSSAT